MSKLKSIHLGEILEQEFLKPIGTTAYKLSQEIVVPKIRNSQILNDRRKITAETALRTMKFFGTSTKFWLGLLNDFDIGEEKANLEKEL